MQTVSVNVSNLCVPCCNRCRYCLLSWDGKLRGVDYGRSTAYARRFYDWLRENRPELSFAFYFGYSMEHPKLLDSISFLREIGSPGGQFLQLNGMKFRDDNEIRELLTALKAHGIALINLTFYGTREYHDRFAARSGDFNYLMAILRTAGEVGLAVEVGISLTRENAKQAGDLMEQLRRYSPTHIFCFVPHAEGRGETLESVRLRQSDYECLPDEVKALFNRGKYRSEGERVRMNSFSEPTKRVLTLNLSPENIDRFEQQEFSETIRSLEKLDDDYYAAIPDLASLAKRYGDPDGECFYSQRDLYLKYQRRYILEHNLALQDVNDERFCFSRRF